MGDIKSNSPWAEGHFVNAGFQIYDVQPYICMQANLAHAIKMRNNDQDQYVVMLYIKKLIKDNSISVYNNYEGLVLLDTFTVVGNKILDKVDPNLINQIYEKGVCSAKDVLKKDEPCANHYFVIKNGNASVLARYDKPTKNLKRVTKTSSYGIIPKNAEQSFALDAIMNPDIKLVTVQGVAGTGKTLLSLAGALEQRRNYHQIYLARPIVPLSNKDIGYLPGDITSKLNPYMEPLWDNLKYIKSQFTEKDKELKQINEMIENEKIVICPLAFIRGRSLSNMFFIVDEAQNLTPHEVKTIITRAGENTKIVFPGDIYQIDTPYLDSQSNGLSYLIDRLKGQNLYAHITLQKGERSELANIANELLYCKKVK